LKRIFILVVSVAYLVLRVLNRVGARTLGRQLADSRVVLTYHAVEPHEIHRFESQIQKLKQLAHLVFADAPVGADGVNSVAVTFDDAFQHIFDVVLPILSAHEVPATIFVPTGYLGVRGTWPSADGSPNDRRDHVAAAETLASVDRRYVKLGSHSVSHPKLGVLSDSDLDRELLVSKRTLETITHESVSMLALPYGSFNGATIAGAKRAGYVRVFANVPVRCVTDSSVMFLGRINVTPRDWPLELGLKIRGAYDWLAVVSPVKRYLADLFSTSRSGERLRSKPRRASARVP
jgi:peptidoglycan/xylan/chitin deacetylase (PgdA/CDA1 family)